ncbi:MAG: acetyl-CoA acetyltransferase [Desulfurococcales archaeon ex4484_42]|nr:MAG: acetyl-CoA acetyltransferase [Desulfurococcales archaeon ex4484_42]
MRRVAIVSAGMVKVGRHVDKSYKDLFAEAALKALDCIGNEVVPEALIVGNQMSSSLFNQDSFGAILADYVGLTGIPAFKVEAACGSGGAAVYTGYMAVASGLHDCVMVAGVEKETDHATPKVTFALGKASDADYELIYGTSFVGLNALIMRLYMETYKAPREAFAKFAVLMHENAVNNPYAQMRYRITVEDVLKSPVIADPIRLLDSAPLSDGAAAIIMCSEELARKITKDYSVIAGIGMGTDHVYIASRRDLLSLSASLKAAEKAYRMASVGPKDIDVVEVHDAFTIMGIMALEGLKLAKQGHGWKLVEEGVIAKDGDIPVNPSGGLKARGHPVGATGVYQVAEIHTQLTNQAGKMQVPNANVGLAQSIGGAGTIISVTILKRP